MVCERRGDQAGVNYVVDPWLGGSLVRLKISCRFPQHFSFSIFKARNVARNGSATSHTRWYVFYNYYSIVAPAT